jgi:ankyrin repeat protein
VNAEQNESGSDLSTDALLEAISISPGDICRDESAMPDEHDILRWCSSLVRKAVDGKSIEIAHFTVKEFLKAIDPAETPTLSRYKYSKPHSLAEMAKTSLTYLSFSDFNVAAPADFLRVTRYPFWEYVAERWDFYYRESTEDSELFKLTLEFFDISVKPEFITWTRYIAWRRDLWKLGTNKLLNPEDPISIADIKQIMKSGGKATVLHWAALLGLRDLCDSLIPKCDVNRDSELGYPLHCVISGGKDSLTPDVKHIAEGMLQNGANLNVRSSWVDDLSPLAFAIQEEHPDLIELLLGAGALVDAESIDEVRTLMTRRRGDNDLIPSRFFDSVQEKNIPEHIRPLMVLTGNFRESTTRQAMNFLGTGRLALLEDLHIYEYGIREAVQYGRTDTLNRLLEYDISLLDKADDDDGKTALHFASENSHLEALEILLSCGANINAVDKDGNTTLHFAISSGENLEAIPILVKFNPDILLQNKEGDNCLHLAARSKHTEYMSSLLNIDAREEGRLARNHEGKTPLLCAIESEISSEMMLLVAESLSPDHFLVRTELQETGLHLSAKRLNIPAMKLFLAKGALNEKDEEGNTALHVIFHAEEMIGQLLDAVRLLIGHGADASISNNQGRLPLHEVIEGIDAWASLKCLKLLAAAKGGSQWCNSETESDVAPLHHLISLEMDKNRLAMFRYLCEDMHANIEVQNEKGQTALLHLTRRAPDGNYRNHPHWSQAMTILLELGANIHSADCDGCTAAHYLCLSSSFSNDLEKLLERGLSTIHRNHAKKAPFDLILEKLEEYEKDKADRRRQNMFDSLNLLISNTTTNDFQTYEQTSGRERMIVLALRSNQASLVSLLANKTLDVDDSYSLDPNILTPLEAACSFSCSTTIFQLLANQCSNLSRQTKQGNTLLMKAVSHGQVEQLKILVFKGVDVNIRNFNGFTALHRAVTRRKLDIMTVLLEAGASTSNRLSRGYSIWHTAVTRDDDDVLKLLCERNDKSGLEDRLADGQTPLLLAISSARIQTVRRLLALGADCRAVDNKGLNALHYAALQQQVEIIELVLGQMKRPNLGAPTSEGATALSLAASKGFVASFWQLLEHGSKSIVRYNDLRSLLHVVAASGEVSMVEMLLAKNQLGDVNAQDKKGWTPLFYAVENGHHVMADTLLNHGADINSLAKDDTDLVDLIAQGGHNHVLVTLLPRGLKLRTRTFTSQKHPPLVTAAIAGHVPVISTLLGAGALLSQVDEQGRNMLHYIAGETFEGAALIAILQYVKAHATEAVLDLEAKDTSGKRALDIAVENNNDEIAYILKASFDELDWL